MSVVAIVLGARIIFKPRTCGIAWASTNTARDRTIAKTQTLRGRAGEPRRWAYGEFSASTSCPPQTHSTRFVYLLLTHSSNSVMSFLTGFEPRLAAPSMERYFEFYSAEERTDLDARDGSWTPYPMQRPGQPALLARTLSALCSLCQIYHDISAWNSTLPNGAPLGSQQDLAFRIHMSQNLAAWNTQLPPSLRPGARTMAHTYYLK
jgi:hypothetical protein